MVKTLSKPIVDHEKYSITTDGDVVSYVQYSEGKCLHRYINCCGYYTVKIDNEYKLVHRLVAEAFVEKLKGCKYVLMKDDNKLNCKSTNLYWHKTGVINRRKPRKDNKPVYKYTLDGMFVDDFENILDAAMDYVNVKSACSNIRKVCYGEAHTYNGFKWSLDKPDAISGKLNITKGCR